MKIKLFEEFTNEGVLFKSKPYKWNMYDIYTLENMGFHKIQNTDDSSVYFIPNHFSYIKNITIQNLITFNNKKYYEVIMTVYKLHHKKGKIYKKFYDFDEMINFLRKSVPDLVKPIII